VDRKKYFLWTGKNKAPLLNGKYFYSFTRWDICSIITNNGKSKDNIERNFRP
jgi:hypothetical protein